MKHGKGKGQSRRKYVAKQKAEKRKLKNETEEDMNQNYRIKEVEKKVVQLTKGARNYLKIASTSQSINTLVGLAKNAVFTATTQLRDLNVINRGAIASTVASADTQHVMWKHIDLAYYINQNPDAEVADIGTGTTVRVMLLCMHNPNGAPGTEDASTAIRYADVFADNDADATTMVSADILRPYSRLRRSNIEVLYDKFHVLAPMQGLPITATNVGVGCGNLIQTHPIRVQLFPSKRSQDQTFNNYDEASVDDFTNVQQNQYWFIYFCDNPSGDAVPPTITYNINVDYVSR